MDQLQKFLASRPDNISRLPRIELMDGTTLSVQVGEGLYCTPRGDTGPWSEVEIGYPSKPIPELYKWMEGRIGETDPTDTVYGYVPVSVLLEAARARGGINWAWTYLKRNR